MYTLLIVDDDEMTRNGLAHLPVWKDYSIRVVGVCADGEEALRCIRAAPPDILFTDVKMPRMDGLTLAEHVKQDHPSVKIVFISGYQDVALIRQALKIEAVDYILKPINLQELRDCFRRLVETLKFQAMRNQMLDDYKESNAFLDANLFYLIANPNVAASEIPESLLKRHSILQPASYFVIGLQARERITEIPSVPDFQIVPWQLESGLLVAIATAPEHYEVRQHDAAAQTLIQELSDHFGNRWIAGCTDSEGEITQVREMAAEVIDMLKNTFSLKDGSVISSPLLPAETVQIHVPGKQDMDSFLNAPDLEAAAEPMHAFLENLRSLHLHSAKEYMNILLPVLHFAEDFLQRSFTLPDGLSLDERIQPMLECRQLDDLCTLCFEYIRDIHEVIHLNRSDETHHRIHEAQQYISQHYAEPLSLEQIAAHVNLAATYLCALFKECTGDTVMNYLMKERVREAMVMLQNPDIRLYDVSERVGYPNASYFSRLFKKEVGMTPSEYRNRYLGRK